MVIKNKIFIKCNAKEFDSWDVCKNLISNCKVNCIFLVGDYHIWSFTDDERKSVGFEPLSTLTSSVFTVTWTLLMSLSVSKTVVSSAKWTKRIWFEDLYMSLMYKRKSTGPNTEPCGTPNVMFDIEELQFLIETNLFLLVRYPLLPFLLLIPWVAAQTVRWCGIPKVARSRLTQCSKSCDLQSCASLVICSPLQCAIRGAQGVLPCVEWGVRPVNWFYHLWCHCP